MKHGLNTDTDVELRKCRLRKSVALALLGTAQFFISYPLMSYRGQVSADSMLFAFVFAAIPVFLVCVFSCRVRSLELAGWGTQITLVSTCTIHKLWPQFFREVIDISSVFHQCSICG